MKTNRIFPGHDKSKILLRHVVSNHVRIFFRLCRGPLAARSRPPHGRDMNRRAVMPKSITVTGVIGRRRGSNCFRGIEVFNADILEIGEIIWSDCIFPIVFSHVVFDWWCHIAKHMRNARASYGQALVHGVMESCNNIFVSKKSLFCWTWEYRIFCLDISFLSISVYFSGFAWGRSLRARVLHMEGVWFV